MCFDAAGTLMTVARPVGVSYAQIANAHGANLDRRLLAEGFKREFPAMPPHAFETRDRVERERLEKAWWHELVERVARGAGDVPDFDAYFDAVYAHFADPLAWRVYPEVRGVLEAVRAQGLRLAVVSNFDSRLEPILRGLALTSYFETVVYSAEAGAAKPDPRIFHAALGRLGVHPSQALHVGDSESADYEGASAAGLHALLLERHGGVAKAHVIDTLEAVPRRLREGL